MQYGHHSDIFWKYQYQVAVKKYLTGQEKDLENEDDDGDYDDGKERTTFQTTANKKKVL